MKWILDTFIKLVGHGKARTYVTYMLISMVKRQQKFQAEVEEMGGTHSPYYQRSKNQCTAMEASIKALVPF